MRYLDLTLPSPAENLALDEALLEEAEAAGRPIETLRFWEPTEPVVVVGRSSRIGGEVHRDACRRLAVPVLRRISGGAAIVTGPGCLMYGVVLSCSADPSLRSVDRAHHLVLMTLAGALEKLQPNVQRRGISDLALGELKFSGNSVRQKRDHLLYHGTLLYDFRLDLIEQCLAFPPRQPDYRDDRPHATFVANLPLEPETIRRALISAWGATEPLTDWPRNRTARLVAEKYGCLRWNEQL
ncbi:MAG: lipoate--protein ligase family protein [Candidatus Nealsonbacteria bacterium]|nr:lipoate--protein ligase family protein [Candidatus Nealsonbacteria bacterium]